MLLSSMRSGGHMFLSILILATIGCACANCSLLSLKVREQFGFPDHQVLKRRRLPTDPTARGGLFYSLVGLVAGSGVAIIHGFHIFSVLLTISTSLLIGYVISKKRLYCLGEQYLKRAYENIYAHEFAAAIQDANEAWRCGRRYQGEAYDLVRAAKELRRSEQSSDEVRLATTDKSPTTKDRRQRSRTAAP